MKNFSSKCSENDKNHRLGEDTVFAKYLSDKGLISTIHKESLKTH